MFEFLFKILGYIVIAGFCIIGGLVVADEIMTKKVKMIELIYRFRQWNKDWDNYDKGIEPIKPPSAEEFAKQLERLYHIKRKNNAET